MGFLTDILPVYIVPQEKRSVVERFGKYTGTMIEPGLNFKLPLWIDMVLFRDIREQTLDIPPQSVITEDNVEIQVDAILWARVKPASDAVRKSFYEIDNWRRAVKELTQTTIRNEFGGMTLDAALTSREKIGASIQAKLDKISEQWGVDVNKIEIKLVDPPDDIKAAMHKQKTAEQERRAMVLEATGRKESAKQDKEAKILLAEGEKQAEILTAEGKAKAIEFVNTAAQEFFVGNAKDLKKLEVAENSLRDNSKIVVPSDSEVINMIGLGEGVRPLPMKKR